ncbi:MAG: hypothetical protein HY511_09030 [Actinobacteria bacterium]|nr:hypothetical protein [Actinomycetota bacterium]
MEPESVRSSAGRSARSTQTQAPDDLSVLRGAKPGDLPIEQPTKIALVINARTAKSLGLTIPPMLRLRATEVLD